MTQTHGLTKYDMFVRDCANDDNAPPLPQVFGRLGRRNPITGTAPDGSPFSAKNLLKAFGKALDHMEDKTDPQGEVGGAMTFFGQFIDHDVTLDATSQIGRRIDPRTIRNVRTPALDLDCVYGDGPEASPHLYSPDHHGFLLFGNSTNPRDLARTCKGVALIGDPRNDENVVVSQLQGLFITMHNLLMTAFEKDAGLTHRALSGIRSRAHRDGFSPKEAPFEAARRVMRLHYQWLVLNDFLPSFVDEEVLKNAVDHVAFHTLPKGFDDASPVMPVEFSGAAYRFGHATVQSKYRLNDGVGEADLFDMRFDAPLAERFNIDFANLLDFPGKSAKTKARPIGRTLASSIFALPFINDPLNIDGETLPVKEARKLPHRNIFRDRFALELPSGQQMARLMGRPAIPAPDELRKKGITKTPLWYYCLHEAESHGGKLGWVGGTIVATVFLRLMALDPESLLCSAEDFTPWEELGAKDGAYSLGHFAAFVEKNRNKVAHAKDLRCPD